MQSDAELVKAVLDGQREVFAVLVKRYERPVRAAAIDILGDHTSVQDAAQEAFIRAYEHLLDLRKPQAFGPWLMKITHRCALSIARKRPAEAVLDSAHILPAESTDGQLDQQKQNLLAAIMKLPESEKQVVMLRYFSCHSVRDVAEVLGRNIGTVTKQLSRAHKRLRNILRDSEL